MIARARSSSFGITCAYVARSVLRSCPRRSATFAGLIPSDSRALAWVCRPPGTYGAWLAVRCLLPNSTLVFLHTSAMASRYDSRKLTRVAVAVTLATASVRR